MRYTFSLALFCWLLPSPFLLALFCLLLPRDTLYSNSPPLSSFSAFIPRLFRPSPRDPASYTCLVKHDLEHCKNPDTEWPKIHRAQPVRPSSNGIQETAGSTLPASSSCSSCPRLLVFDFLPSLASRFLASVFQTSWYSQFLTAVYNISESWRVYGYLIRIRRLRDRIVVGQRCISLIEICWSLQEKS